MIRRKKPRDWAADVVRGDRTIDDVPEDKRHWVEFYIRSVAEQIEGARKRRAEQPK